MYTTLTFYLYRRGLQNSVKINIEIPLACNNTVTLNIKTAQHPLIKHHLNNILVSKSTVKPLKCLLTQPWRERCWCFPFVVRVKNWMTLWPTSGQERPRDKWPIAPHNENGTGRNQGSKMGFSTWREVWSARMSFGQWVTYLFCVGCAGFSAVKNFYCCLIERDFLVEKWLETTYSLGAGKTNGFSVVVDFLFLLQ